MSLFDNPNTDPKLAIRPETLQKAAELVANTLPDHCGFIILAAPYGVDKQDNGQMISNVSRESAVAILKTVLFRVGVNEEWMKGV